MVHSLFEVLAGWGLLVGVALVESKFKRREEEKDISPAPRNRRNLKLVFG